MGITNGERQRIGRIFRLRKRGQFQQSLDHPLHLHFARLAVAHHGKLCLRRREFDDRNRPDRGIQKNHPLRHSELNRALRIFQDELRLDSNSFWFEPIQKRLNPLE